MPIFDQGYQHWKGPLAGHAWRWLAVARHGVRATLKGRIVKGLLFLAWVPAIALVVVLATWGLLEQQAESVLTFLRRVLPAEVIARPQDFRAAVWTVAYMFFFKAELACSLFLVLVVGPNLISRDLRFNALPLYFSRPLRRIDYFLGKLGVIGFFLLATLVAPAAGAYLLGVAFSLDLGVVRDTYRVLIAGVLYGLIITASAGRPARHAAAHGRRAGTQAMVPAMAAGIGPAQYPGYGGSRRRKPFRLAARLFLCRQPRSARRLAARRRCGLGAVG